MKKLVLTLAAAAGVWAQLPDGPGREELERVCKGCHEVARSVSKRQDRDGWQSTLTKMIAFGTKATDHELQVILDYLAKNWPADEIPPVNVNTASAIELESRLSLKRSQAAAVIAHRTKNGKFKSFDDLKRVQGLDPEKLEAKRSQIAF